MKTTQTDNTSQIVMSDIVRPQTFLHAVNQLKALFTANPHQACCSSILPCLISMTQILLNILRRESTLPVIIELQKQRVIQQKPFKKIVIKVDFQKATHFRNLQKALCS